MLDDQLVQLADDKGNPTGKYAPKELAHTGAGLHHLAITVLISNSKGEVLLQRRKHRIFDDIWDLTGATHPLHLGDHDESFKEATQRCLEREYDIPLNTVQLQNLGAFSYNATYQDGLRENEYCVLMVGEYNGNLKLNNQVGYFYKWMKKENFLEDIKKNPTNYSPWARESVKLLSLL